MLNLIFRYERKALLEHFKINGNFDPVTRKTCKINDLIPNLSLKQVIEDFLKE